MTAKKILVIDDVYENLIAIISIIEKHLPGIIIYQANDGTTALKALKRLTPDIIISDWDMPEMNGLELVQALQASPEMRHVPVIISTGVMIEPENMKIALEAGAIDYIRKPTVPVELIARIHSALTIAGYQKKLIGEKEGKILENTMFTNRINRFLAKISASINEITEESHMGPGTAKKLSEIALGIDEKIKGSGWQEFSIAYNKLHPGYEQRLLAMHPSLNPTELKLSALIRLGLSVKELAGLMFVAPESMKVFRSRLRKKLGLETAQNLQSYLSAV